VGAALAIVVAAGAVRGQTIDRLMAVVSGRVILLSDVALAMRLGLVKPAAGGEAVAEALDTLIERQLMLIEVERYDPPAPSAEAIQQRFDALVASAGRAGGLARVVAESGVSEDQLRAYVRDDLRIETYLDQRFASTTESTEAELVEYYRSHEQAFTRDGVLRPFDEVRAEIASRLARERRQELVVRWIGSLRRRAEIQVPYLAAR
jgi:hypothetical protein